MDDWAVAFPVTGRLMLMTCASKHSVLIPACRLLPPLHSPFHSHAYPTDSPHPSLPYSAHRPIHIGMTSTPSAQIYSVRRHPTYRDPYPPARLGIAIYSSIFTADMYTSQIQLPVRPNHLKGQFQSSGSPTSLLSRSCNLVSFHACTVLTC